MKPRIFKNGKIRIGNKIIGNWETQDKFRDSGDNYSLCIIFSDDSIFDTYCANADLDLFYAIITNNYYVCDFATSERIDLEIGCEDILGGLEFTLNASELKQELRNYNLKRLI